LVESIPKGHPRYLSLTIREKLVEGFRSGIVVPQGLLAHGRGEAFDYLLGECTTEAASYAEMIACGLLIVSKAPIISVNGNTAALCSKEIVELSKVVNAKLEVNLFHNSQLRSELIGKVLERNGADEVLGIKPFSKVAFEDISSSRKFIDEDGIAKADTVLLALEDGDRTQALINAGKKVISVDLNPLSRTAQSSSITIVDNLVRAVPNMTKFGRELSGRRKPELLKMISEFNNRTNLLNSIRRIRIG
jgi:4-phosphopantoate--beta-alanine ligase